MPAERLSMRKVREVLRLKHALGMSYRKISEATGVGKTQAAEYVRRALVAGIARPVPEGVDDTELDRRLFPVGEDSVRTRPAIDWPAIQTELKRRGVTLALLWQEYLAEHPNGYSYTRFCELHNVWRRTITATMRQTHIAGERLFVDWAGDTIGVVDPATGEEHRARIFVAALGASNFTYAEARWTETLPDWIGAHVNALNAIGGVPQALVPDNLKAGITKPSRYEPGINRTYQDLADHYGCVVLPTRIVKPRDKAKVEVAVQLVERFVLAKLRNVTFFSLAELNVAIRDWTSPAKVEGFSDSLSESGEHDGEIQGWQARSLRRRLQAGGGSDSGSERSDDPRGGGRPGRWHLVARQVEVSVCGGRASGGPHDDLHKELARLRRENELLRAERDLQKKATAFFAKETSR